MVIKERNFLHVILQELAQLVFMLFLIFTRTCKIILVQTMLNVAKMLKKKLCGHKTKDFCLVVTGHEFPTLRSLLWSLILQSLFMLILPRNIPLINVGLFKAEK